ncbi:MAG: wax ester/triacylglycerol synthase family O-acyltransferase [Balneolia bacterium]|nr:wax ester/triacylglycerol synthase family O-acyltransferase [Balneolia bacterium]
MNSNSQTAGQYQTEVMSGADSAWLRMEQDANQMVITGMLRLNPAPDYETFKKLLEARLLVYDRFTQRVVNRETIPIWESVRNPDLNYHVKQIRLDDDDRFETVQDYVGHVMSNPLDFARPLWEMHLVSHNGSCTLVAKLHHCIADGIALVRILLSLATVSPGGAYFQPHLEYQPKKRNSHRRKSGAAAELIDGAGRIIKALYKFVMMPSDTPTSLKGALQHKKQAAWSESISLDEVKQLASAHRVTINDIMLWLACNALRHYLVSEGKDLSRYDNTGITMPVNLRTESDTTSTGNRFGLIFLKLPIGVEEPEERLRIIQKEMNEIKASGEAMVAFGVLRLIGKLPLLVEKTVISFLSRKCTAVVTNVPGPKRKLYLAGSEMEDIMFWVPKSGQLGLGISLISYDNRVRIGVASDAVLMSNPAGFAKLFNEAFESEKKKALNT